jgi:hypothetical protein
MKDNFWGLIWCSFLEIQGILIGFMGVVITILLTRFPVKTNIPIDLAIVILFFMLLLIATLFSATYKGFDKYKKNKILLNNLTMLNNELEAKVNRRWLPKILLAQQPQGKTGVEIECLLENSELFSNDTFISFYYTGEDKFERLIGTGVVVTVQVNGKIQALMDRRVNGYEDILEKLARNDATILDRTVVKPSITREMIQNIYTP